MDSVVWELVDTTAEELTEDEMSEPEPVPEGRKKMEKQQSQKETDNAKEGPDDSRGSGFF